MFIFGKGFLNMVNRTDIFHSLLDPSSITTWHKRGCTFDILNNVFCNDCTMKPGCYLSYSSASGLGHMTIFVNLFSDKKEIVYGLTLPFTNDSENCT